MERRAYGLPPELWPRLGAGLALGALGGLVSLIVLAIAFAVQGRGFWQPFQLLAANIAGDWALLPSSAAGSVFLGLIACLVQYAVLGGAFSLMTLSHDRARVAGLAALYGLCVGLALKFIILPTGINLAWAARTPTLLFLGSNLGFGLFLSPLPTLERRFSRIELKTAVEEELIVRSVDEEIPPLSRKRRAS